MTYDQLRAKCIRFWGMHPDTKGTISELWADVNSHGLHMRQNIAEPSAVMLFGELAEYIEQHRSGGDSRDG